MKSPEREPEPTKRIEIFFRLPQNIHTILDLIHGQSTNAEVIELFFKDTLKPAMMVDWRGKKRRIENWALLEPDKDSENETPLKAHLYVGKDVYAVRRGNKIYPTIAQEPEGRLMLSPKGVPFFKEVWYSDGKARKLEVYDLIKDRQFITSTGIRFVVGKQK